MLQGAGGLALAGLGGCATEPVGGIGGTARPAGYISLAPVRASPDRIFDVTVCLRPFRAEGPRLDAEQVGDKLVVHNYGHGGSGWSLSWGSATVALEKAMTASPAEIAVIGCGAIGLTSAILAQRAGAKVTIYAKEYLPETRSVRATGSFTPDSRIALASKVAAGFPALWERMTRISFKAYRAYLGLPGSPVEWNDRYIVADTQTEGGGELPGSLDFADYSERILDLQAPSTPLPPGSTPFRNARVRRYSSMMFNIADYGHTLLTDFLLAGGRIQRTEFHAPSELAALPQKVVIDCTGYGARALWRDDSIVPVRGQIAWLIPQPEVDYGVIYEDVNMLSRRDGIVLQMLEGGDMRGYGDDNETPDHAEALTAVARIAALYARFAA